jgi:hypothetical protein
MSKEMDNSTWSSSSATGEHRGLSTTRPSIGKRSLVQTNCIDLDTIKSLDEEYEKALVLREIGWNARYISVRQNAGLSTYFMISFLIVGLVFFQLNTNWSITESLLFSIYSITTVGYGQHEVPRIAHVQLFISLYIFLGIALLTILASQLYQWVVLEVTWLQYEKDSERLVKQKKQSIRNEHDLESAMMRNHDGNQHLISQSPSHGRQSDDSSNYTTKLSDRFFDMSIKSVNFIQSYTKDNPAGKMLVVMIPFLFLILLGATVVGSIEGWNMMESIYFAVVSMTTTGYGDYYPEKLASSWFCIVWLPFSVGFLSLYLGSVANWYIDVSGRNVKRIEMQLRRRIQAAREEQEQERAEALSRLNTGGFEMDFSDASDINGEHTSNNSVISMQDVIPSHLHHKTQRRLKGKKVFDALEESDQTDEYWASKGTGSRRKDVMINSGLFKGILDIPTGNGSDSDSSKSDAGDESSIRKAEITTKDVILEVKYNLSSPRRTQNDEQSVANGAINNDILSLKSTKHYTTARGIEKKPTFALRILFQERLSHIIAHEIAGYQSRVEIENNTLAVTIDSLKHTADKWLIPKRARKAFRAVAFETLYFVGERDLIVRGADAIFDLNIHEVQGLFAPVLAALGDADTMETWLQQTHVMADNELHGPAEQLSSKLGMVHDRHENQISQNLTANPKVTRNVIGNAVRNNM